MGENLNTPDYWDEQYQNRPRRIDEPRLQYLIGEMRDWWQYHTYNAEQAIMDVGCGDGEMLRLLHVYFPAWLKYGVDICPQTVRRNRLESPSFWYDVADAQAGLPYGRNADVIWCGETLEHLEHPDKAVENMAAALRPGGYLVCSVPNEDRNRSPEHLREFTVWDAIGLTTRHGKLRNVCVKSGDGWQSVVWTVIVK